MPILEIEMVTEDGTVPDGLARSLAEAAGGVFDAEPGRVWVRLRGLRAADYAENGGGPTDDVYPVFVSVLLAELPDPAAWRATVAALTEVVADCCGRPSANVHVLRLPAARGRMAFGGRVVGEG